MRARAVDGTLAARMLLRVVELCRKGGHDVDVMCARVGLTPATLEEPEARVPYATAERFAEIVIEVTGDESFGLRLATDVRDVRSFDAGMLLLMASPTVRAALERMVAHQRYWGDGDRATLVATRGGSSIRYVLPGAQGAYARHADECAMAEIAIGVRVLTGAPLHPRVVRFRHRAPSSLAVHHEVFGCAMEFAAAHTELVFDDAALDTPMQHANAMFAGIFEQQVERAVARLPAVNAMSSSVRGVMRGALAAGQCTLAGTARALGVSTRTLQRRLRDEGTSFADLVDALRHETALACLERGMESGDVASLLGYADTTAFHHAFRRWTGSTPLRYTSAEPSSIEADPERPRPAD